MCTQWWDLGIRTHPNPSHGHRQTTIWTLGYIGVCRTKLSPSNQSFMMLSKNIQQMHRDHVPTIPPSFHLLGSSPISHNQGMVRFSSEANPSTPLPPIQIITTQGHPEFNESIVTAIIEQRLQSNSISQEAAADAETRRFWKTDGVDVIGKAIWEVILRK